MTMKQFTSPEQTAKLIELGFEKPKSVLLYAQSVDCDNNYGWKGETKHNGNYSIGELIEMLPTYINWTPRVILLNSIEYSFGAVDSELFIFNLYDELIDNLFDAVVKLKAEGVI